MLKVNVENFKEVIKKATLANSIDSVNIKFKGGNVISGMRTEDRQGIINLDMPNNVIEGLKKEEIDFNFSEPGKLVLPYLNLIDEEMADIEIKDDYITVKSGGQRSRLSFCSPMMVSTFDNKRSKKTEHFLEMDIDDEFLSNLVKIKKVGTKYGKVYFSVEKNILYMESADKQNKYLPTLKIALCKSDSEDLSMCFNFRHFVNTMTVINGAYSEFKIKFTFVSKDDIKLGMIHTEKNDNTENYYLLSVSEET